MHPTFGNASSRMAALLGLTLAAQAASAADVTVYLQARSHTVTLPGGVAVPMWSFFCDPTAPSNVACVPSAPGAPQPRIAVAPGDNLTVYLSNLLPLPTSIIIPGQAGGGDPVTTLDARGRPRVTAFTHETAPAATGLYFWSALREGTYLYESGSQPSLQVPMGLQGALVVGPVPGVACAAGQVAAYGNTASCHDADAVLLFSEVDTIQNVRVAEAAATLTPMSPACEGLAAWNPAATAGYPCTVDYHPTHFLTNGVAFDAASPPSPLPSGDPGDRVLLRLLNAGQHTHAPALVGRHLGLLAEDGNAYPGLTRQEVQAFLPAGKSLDVLVDMPADATYTLFDRMPFLGGSGQSGGGALARLQVGAGSPPAPPATTYAVNDLYDVTEDTALVIGAPGVLANDVGLAGATVTVTSPPAHGTLALAANGSFTYTPHPDFSGHDGFSYRATAASGAYPAQVALRVSFANDAPAAADDGPYANAIGSAISIPAPGVLGNDVDPDGDALAAAVVAGPASGILVLNADGGFTYTPNPGFSGTDSFTYQATDGALASAPATVALVVRPVANITLAVRDPLGAAVTDYRWIVQEDATQHVDPAAPLPTSATLSTTFHRSYMPVIAQGCTGAGCNPANPGVPVAPFTQAALDPARRHYVSVLPSDAGTGAGHALGAAPIPAGSSGATITVIVNNQPIPTAQINVLVFEDISPTNGAPDQTEPGLGGFQIVLEDAAGRYGQAGGTVSQDAYGSPLRNSLDCFGASPPPVGVILSCPDGRALIKDLAPGKYGVVAVAPVGRGTWSQSATIEGTKVIDAWVKAGEPPYFLEFGGPGPHVFIGFVNPEHTTVPPGGTGSNTISGDVTLLRAAKPPSLAAFDSGSYDALAHTRAWVGVNSNAGTGPNIATVQADPDGHFEIPGIPNGTYQVAIWDQYLDQIIWAQAVTVPGGGSMGNIPVPPWFGRLEHNVFLDDGCGGTIPSGVGDGIRQSCEVGLQEQNVNLRFRDGTVFQSFPTDTEGFVPFDQVFPFFAWQVAEVDYTRFRPTGVTVTVDGGGDVSGGPYPGLLNPQAGSPRTDTAPSPVLLEGFQSVAGMTSIFEWGKLPYAPGENGGISGIVFYASTRGENDPRLTVGDPWEPGIPGVTVRLYRYVARATDAPGAEPTALALVEEVTTDSWDANLPTGCPGEDPAAPFVTQTLAGDATRCFDGYRNFEQVRPAVFDGGYAFTGIPPGKYVVEVVPPPGYELVKEEDKNVDFGDAFATPPAALSLPGGGLVLFAVLPDQAMILAARAAQPGIAQPPCVGALHTVPAQLSLFPGVDTYAPFAGTERPLCNRKEVVLSDQGQAAADFHLFTSTPVAGQAFGLVNDDTAFETNPASPWFGDKFPPAFLPFSLRDWKGQEIYRGYSDAFGRYNGLVPSTYTANIPMPSGYSPAMHVVCLNDPGPIPGPGGTLIVDPLRNPAYGNVCYTLQYMPGTTTYLDTPVLPQAAFAAGFNPVDCAFPSGTPVIARVDGTATGPLVAPGGTLTIQSQGQTPVANPAYEGPTGTTPPTILRDFGFGPSGTVTLGIDGGTTGPALTDVVWTDGTITGTVPAGTAPGPYQLIVTRSDGRSSTNAVTVTVGDELPFRVGAGQPYATIQAAIDAAPPGGLVLVDPGVYEELVIMWKPVRLQGSGTSTIINALPRPVEKLETWRLRVTGLVSAGTVDLLPGQAAVGDPVAPGPLGTEMGAGVTVLARETGPSRFAVHPSRIDGFTITGADGGGGIFVNGYATNLEIANNQVTGNSGVLHGGIRVGHPFLPDLTANANGLVVFNHGVFIHHNAITLNGGQGENSVAGGLALCAGTNNYLVSRNFVCGNFSQGDGGGIGHLGLSNSGLIERNEILFNQSINQGLNRSGGGLFIGGEPPVVGALTLGSGSVDVDANLIQGNHAATGHGGGIRTQFVNGTDVDPAVRPAPWRLRFTNNMVVNNVAGWSGAGISLHDTVNGQIINNTVANNDSTATVGALIVANESAPQPAGISAEHHSLPLAAALGQPAGFSSPQLVNTIVWHNRAFRYDATTGTPRLLPVLTPATIGACPAGASYWDLGVLGEPRVNPAVRLNPVRSILTSTAGYSATNLSGDPAFVNPYCNGGRELGAPGPVSTPQPIQVAGEVLEGGNFVGVRYGPLTRAWPAGSPPWHYHIGPTSAGLNNGNNVGGLHFALDFDGDARPQGAGTPSGVDRGADERPQAAPGAVSFSSGAFGNVVIGTTASRTITATVAVAPVTFTSSSNPAAPFAKTADTCSGATVGVGGTCTFTVTYTPPALPATSSGAFTVSSSAVGSPHTVSLSGSGVRQVAFTSATLGTLSGPLLGAWSLAFGNRTGLVSSTVTITVQGTTPVTFGALGVVNAIPALPAFSKGADTCSGATVPGGATCTVVVNFVGPPGNNLLTIRAGLLTAPHNGASSSSPLTLGLSGS